MTTGPIIDLDAWAAQVVADPPPLPDDDSFADWAIQMLELAREAAQ